MTKRFEVYKVIGSFHEWSIEDNVTDNVVSRSIMHKYEADRLCEKLNELNDENQKLKNSDTVQEFERRLINLININKELINDNRKLKEEVKELKAINARQKALLDELKRG